MRSAATLGNQISALESQLEAASAARARSQKRMAELRRQIETVNAGLEELRNRRQELVRREEDHGKLLNTATGQLEQYQQQHTARQEKLAELRGRHTAAAERSALLEELQQRQEGLSAGVKEVLAAAGDASGGPYQGVCGLVADLLSVSVEVAPLIDVALGQTAQHVVAAPGGELLEHLQTASQRLAGRVGFVWLERDEGRGTRAESHPLTPSPPHPLTPSPLDLQQRPGVLGRADRFVQTEPRFAQLAERLLGRTWIVEKLAHATELARSAGDRVNFVTLAGELLRADGILVVGPHHASTGLISRRSQLRALKTQLAELETEIGQLEADDASLGQQIQRQQQQVEACTRQHRAAVDALAEHRFKITAAEDGRARLDQQHSVLQSELRAAETQHDTASGRLADTRDRRKQLDAELAELETKLDGLGERIDRLEAQRQVHGRQTTQTKVELAKSEERLRNLHAQMRQLEESRQERRRAITDSQEQLVQCTNRAKASRAGILRAESEIAELYLCKERFAAGTVELIDRRESLRRRRTELTAEAREIRVKVRKLEEDIHARDLAANEVRHERGNLAGRLREDYGIELAELEHEPTDEEQLQREEVQQEIDELRRKIGNLGHVNIEALEELEQLQTRHETLRGQYDDLTAAKTSLEQIIEKINADSRRLFSETLQTVKDHFQTLFRDLFGGGHADIVLEEGVDILETGIEIVARPPGKEPRSISLLSGGEKTLTCVALLLAIFRSRPSPFCVLDEVDAALDEANIDRFIQVLQGFLAWTQFIIVTHCKKTMTCADTMYGVTMQETGVSKQVSVRFEDVSEDGQISPERLRQEESQPAADDKETHAA